MRAAGTIAELRRGEHASLLYDRGDDPIALVAPYVREGLGVGERCVYVVGEHDPQRIRRTFAAHGIDVAAEEARGALAFVTQWEVSFPGGVFDPSAMIAYVREAIRATTRDDFSALRLVAEMTWALQMGVGCDRLIHYEAIGNGLYPDEPLVALCMYDRSRFPAEVCRDAIRAHPLVALGDRVHTNSYYELPDAAFGGTTASERLDWMLEQLKRLRAAEQEREERIRAELAVRARDEFVAVAAHELRTPLTALSIHVDTLLRRARAGTLDPAAALALAERLRSQTDRQTRLVNELLDGSRVAAGTLAITRERVDLAALVRDVAARFAGMTALRVETPASLGAFVDPLRIEQILTNLLENTRRHCPRGTAVTVSLQNGGDTIRLDVRDHGPGVALEHRAHIFERYYRTRTAFGLGLGLHVSRELAKRHGGDLFAEFPDDGGSRFSLTLPCT